MIELIVFDIDGVITDGSVIVDSNGNEQKQINLKDIDAIFELHRKGYKLVALTGENTKIVNYFEKRFPWDYFYRGNKKKKETLIQIEQITGINRKNICYIGDGKYDIDSLIYAGLGVCPADAIDRAKSAADVILQNNGGKGCIWELISILEEYNQVKTLYSFFNHRLEEHIHIFKKLAANSEWIETAIEIGNKLVDVLEKERTFYLYGNERNTVNARYMAEEIRYRFQKKHIDVKIELLIEDSSVQNELKKRNNDENTFVQLIEKKAQSKDILVGITSGIDEKIGKILQCAKKNGIISILLTEKVKSSELNSLADYIVNIESCNCPISGEIHRFIIYIIVEYVEKIFGRK